MFKTLLSISRIYLSSKYTHNYTETVNLTRNLLVLKGLRNLFESKLIKCSNLDYKNNLKRKTRQTEPSITPKNKAENFDGIERNQTFEIPEKQKEAKYNYDIRWTIPLVAPKNPNTTLQIRPFEPIDEDNVYQLSVDKNSDSNSETNMLQLNSYSTNNTFNKKNLPIKESSYCIYSIYRGDNGDIVNTRVLYSSNSTKNIKNEFDKVNQKKDNPYQTLKNNFLDKKISNNTNDQEIKEIKTKDEPLHKEFNQNSNTPKPLIKKKIGENSIPESKNILKEEDLQNKHRITQIQDYKSNNNDIKNEAKVKKITEKMLRRARNKTTIINRETFEKIDMETLDKTYDANEINKNLINDSQNKEETFLQTDDHIPIGINLINDENLSNIDNKLQEETNSNILNMPGLKNEDIELNQSGFIEDEMCQSNSNNTIDTIDNDSNISNSELSDTYKYSNVNINQNFIEDNRNIHNNLESKETEQNPDITENKYKLMSTNIFNKIIEDDEFIAEGSNIIENTDDSKEEKISRNSEPNIERVNDITKNNGLKSTPPDIIKNTDIEDINIQTYMNETDDINNDVERISNLNLLVEETDVSTKDLKKISLNNDDLNTIKSNILPENVEQNYRDDNLGGIRYSNTNISLKDNNVTTNTHHDDTFEDFSIPPTNYSAKSDTKASFNESGLMFSGKGKNNHDDNQINKSSDNNKKLNHLLEKIGSQNDTANSLIKENIINTDMVDSNIKENIISTDMVDLDIHENKSLIDINNSNIQDNQSTIDIVDSNILENKTPIDMVNSNLLENKTTIDMVNSDIHGNKSTIPMVDSNIHENKSTIDMVDSDIHENKSPIDMVDSNLLENKTTIDIVDSNLLENKSTIDMVDSDIHENKSTIDMVNSDIHGNKSPIDMVDSDIHENKTTDDMVDLDIHENKTTIDMVDSNTQDYKINTDNDVYNLFPKRTNFIKDSNCVEESNGPINSTKDTKLLVNATNKDNIKSKNDIINTSSDSNSAKYTSTVVKINESKYFKTLENGKNSNIFDNFKNLDTDNQQSDDQLNLNNYNNKDNSKINISISENENITTNKNEKVTDVNPKSYSLDLSTNLDYTDDKDNLKIPEKQIIEEPPKNTDKNDLISVDILPNNGNQLENPSVNTKITQPGDIQNKNSDSSNIKQSIKNIGNLSLNDADVSQNAQNLNSTLIRNKNIHPMEKNQDHDNNSSFPTFSNISDNMKHDELSGIDMSNKKDDIISDDKIYSQNNSDTSQNISNNIHADNLTPLINDDMQNNINKQIG